MPIRVWDLGLYSTIEAVSYSFVTSRVQSWVLQDYILRDSGIHGMNIDFDKVLYDFSVVFLDFDLSGFTIKDIVPHKAQHVLENSPFKLLQIIVFKVDLIE